MGIDFVAYDASGATVFCESVKWLRDEAPHELFYGSQYAMKEVLMKSDITGYRNQIRDFLDGLRFIQANPEVEEIYDEWYDKWESVDGDEISIEDWLYWKLRELQGTLTKCVELDLSVRWSI